MVTKETERLVIRNFRQDDWRDVQEMALQYEASEYAAYDHPWPTAEEQVRGATEWFASGDEFLAVCLKSTGKLIGLVSLNRREDCAEVTFDLGYVFNFDYHGQGYATEACQALVDHAFADLGAQRLSTGTAAVNGPSCRLLERLGLKPGEQSKGSLRKDANGQPIEFVGVAYAMSREDWRRSRPEV